MRITLFGVISIIVMLSAFLGLVTKGRKSQIVFLKVSALLTIFWVLIVALSFVGVIVSD